MEEEPEVEMDDPKEEPDEITDLDGDPYESTELEIDDPEDKPEYVNEVPEDITEPDGDS